MFSQNEREKETLMSNEKQATPGGLCYALIVFFSQVKSPNYWALQIPGDFLGKTSRLFKPDLYVHMHILNTLSRYLKEKKKKEKRKKKKNGEPYSRF